MTFCHSPGSSILKVVSTRRNRAIREEEARGATTVG
jgi:hypothetical protein